MQGLVVVGRHLAAAHSIDLTSYHSLNRVDIKSHNHRDSDAGVISWHDEHAPRPARRPRQL